MQPWIRQFSIMMFATLMFFSTTGVAIYNHICGCPTPVIQTAPGSEPDHSCCHVPEIPVCCEEGDHSLCDTEDSHNCTNEVTYLKVPIISTMPVQELALSVMSFEMADLQISDAGLSDEFITEKRYIRPEILPPRAGGPLFIFLQQLKIPSPEDHC